MAIIALNSCRIFLNVIIFCWIISFMRIECMRNGTIVPPKFQQKWCAVMYEKTQYIDCMVTPIITGARKHFLTLADCFSKNGPKGAVMNAAQYKIAYSSFSMNWRDLIENYPSYEIDYVIIPTEYNPDEESAARLASNIAVVVVKQPITYEMLNLAMIGHFQLPWYSYVTAFTWGKTAAPFDDRSHLHYATGLTNIKACSDRGNGYLLNEFIAQGSLLCFNTLNQSTYLDNDLDDFSGPVFAGNPNNDQFYDMFLIGIFYGDLPIVYHMGEQTKIAFIATNVAYWAPWIQYIVHSDGPPTQILQTKIGRLPEDAAYKWPRMVPYTCRNVDARFARVDWPQPTNNSADFCSKYKSYHNMNCWWPGQEHTGIC